MKNMDRRDKHFLKFQFIIIWHFVGYAARIDFNPLAVKHFRLPSNVKFIVAQSLAIKNKAASNDFNTRVVECRLGSQVKTKNYLLFINILDGYCDFQIIAKKLNLNWEQMTILAMLQKHIGKTFDEMIELVHRYLHIREYSKKEVIICLGK